MLFGEEAHIAAVTGTEVQKDAWIVFEPLVESI
jgi:hypothetical protein